MIKFKHKIYTLVIIISLIISILLPVNVLGGSNLFIGVPNEDVSNTPYKIGQLQDTAYTYTGADIVVYDYGVTMDDQVTAVVIGTGLKQSHWLELESCFEMDLHILGVLTKYNEAPLFISQDDYYLLDFTYPQLHTMEVISVIGTIARGINVIVVDLKMSENEPIGFSYGETAIWQWLVTNHAQYDIDIVVWSMVNWIDFITPTIKNLWSDLIANDVMLITGAGNHDSYENYDSSIGKKMRYQSSYSEWYSIGSIDHEDRDGIYASVRGERTRSSRTGWGSSWYYANTSHNQVVNWLSPGNGIPIYTRLYTSQGYVYKWVYGGGTSYSTPYFAAIVALIIRGYQEGISENIDPSLQQVIEILLYSSSRRTFDQKMGYGYVDAYVAYGRAFYIGRRYVGEVL